MKNTEKIDLKSKNSEKNKTDLSQFALHRAKSGEMAIISPFGEIRDRRLFIAEGGGEFGAKEGEIYPIPPLNVTLLK